MHSTQSFSKSSLQPLSSLDSEKLSLALQAAATASFAAHFTGINRG